MLFAAALPGCAGAVPVSQVAEKSLLDVRLASTTRTHVPGRPLKFFVDITNQGEQAIDLSALRVELQALSPGPERAVRLRQDWSYNFGDRQILLGPGKKLSVPVVPEAGVEFRLDVLQEGTYEIVAVVNERFTSPPVPLFVSRPDLNVTRRA